VDYYAVTVYFDAQGGTVFPDSKVVTNGLDYGALPTPVYDDPDVLRNFRGWFTETRGLGKEIAPTSTVDSILDEQILYAKWTKDNWIDYAETNWYTGQGTNYLGTPEQLAGVARLVNDGVTNFADCTLILTNDISLALSNREWTAIGTLELSPEDGEPYNILAFGGMFDGNGHTISGLRITESWVGVQGLFGVSEGIIQDLSISNVFIRLTERKIWRGSMRLARLSERISELFRTVRFYLGKSRLKHRRRIHQSGELSGITKGGCPSVGMRLP
jgi:hypothetical protein